MVSRLNHLPLALILQVACGPGTNTTDNTTDTSNPNTATGTTVDPTTVDPTDALSTAGTTDTTTTTDPSATEATTEDPTGGDVCPDQFPQNGEPCTSNGLTCGGPCEDPCSFCNISQCEGGVWTQLEVFPANCLDCETVCTFVVPAACEAGPPMQADCVTGCMATQNGPCGLTYNISLACIGDMPAFSCDQDGNPNVASCELQFAALYECLG